MRKAAALTLALALALAACRGEKSTSQQQGQVTKQTVLTGKEQGVTPMKDRVAVIGLLNKRNGIVRNIRMKPGQSVRAGDVVVRLRACETTAPWEQEKLTGAFLQLEVEGSDKKWRRVFSGWVYKESPSLNVVEHPVYDVWPKSCAMTYPSGPEAPAAPVASSNRSSASRSGGDDETPAANRPDEASSDAETSEPAAEPAAPPPSAADSNAT